MEDLQEWKVALESALTQAPNASHVMGQNGIFTNDHADAPVSVEEQSMFVHFSIDLVFKSSCITTRSVLSVLRMSKFCSL